MSKPRVLLGFSSMNEHDVEQTAGAVLGGLYSHSEIYTNPPLTFTVLQAKLKAFTDAAALQAQGGPAATAVKNAARAALIASLRLLALYVQQTIDANDAYGLAELLLSGFEAVSNNRARHALSAPRILAIDNAGTGTLKLRVQPDPHAAAYEVQAKTDADADYHTKGLFRSTRGMEATELTPGTNYTFRVRGVGGTTGYSDWSDPVSHRSL